MPSQQQTNPRQQTINWANSTPIRETPSRSTRTVIHDYSQLERPDFTPRNPSKAAPRAESNTYSQPLQDDDIEIEETQDNGTDIEASGSSSECQPETPSRPAIQSTVIIKRRQLQKKARRPRSETTWTQHYFTVTTLDETWVNEGKKGKPILQNRLWVCKLCGPTFKSTDKERHGNTSKLNNHLRDEHEMTKKKHQLGEKPIVKGSQKGAIDAFAVIVDPIPNTEEAILQFFAVTCQLFDLIKHKTFLNLFRSIGTVSLIQTARTLHNRQKIRFNDTRRELQRELERDCQTFSISFDG